MERKRSFQSKMEYRNRFERCKTPMGSVPISVIMGFEYPLEDASGRGENSVMTSDRIQESSLKTNYNSSCYTTTQQAATSQQSYRTTGLYSWPSPLDSSRVEEPKKVRFARAATEARDLLTTSRDRYVRTSDTREHPLQQPCRYPAALSSYTSASAADAQPSRFTRARTVGPPKVVSPWRQAGFPSSRTAHWGTSPTSKTYYSSVRSRFL